eukprot:g1396.t1
MERWAIENARKIDLSLPVDESRHEYVVLHEEWCGLYENELSRVLRDHGATQSDFCAALDEGRDASGKASNSLGSENSMFIEMLISTGDYAFWLEMMRETAEDDSDRDSELANANRRQSSAGESGGGGGGDSEGGEGKRSTRK